MEKLVVNICQGTTCFVMGGANLQELIELLPKKFGDKVEVKSSVCLGLCNIDFEYAKSPYVKVGEDIVYEATVDKVVAFVEEKLNSTNNVF